MVIIMIHHGRVSLLSRLKSDGRSSSIAKVVLRDVPLRSPLCLVNFPTEVLTTRLECCDRTAFPIYLHYLSLAILQRLRQA